MSVAPCTNGVVVLRDLTVTVPAGRSWVREVWFLVWRIGKLGGRGGIVRGSLEIGLGVVASCGHCDWSILADRDVPSFLVDEGGQVSRVIGVSCEILVDDIGVPVPVPESAFGVLSDDSALSREVFHDSWWCLAS